MRIYSTPPGDYKKAAALWQKVLQLEPNSTMAVNNLAVARLYSGTLAEVSPHLFCRGTCAVALLLFHVLRPFDALAPLHRL